MATSVTSQPRAAAEPLSVLADPASHPFCLLVR
jgi:hypothetical protein